MLCDPMNCSTPGFPVLHYPRACSNSSMSRWCHPTISFSSCPQSLPTSGSFSINKHNKKMFNLINMEIKHINLTSWEGNTNQKWVFPLIGSFWLENPWPIWFVKLKSKYLYSNCLSFIILSHHQQPPSSTPNKKNISMFFGEEIRFLRISRYIFFLTKHHQRWAGKIWKV